MKTPKSLAPWLKRVTSWASVAARIWGRYWLLIIGSSLAFGSVILKWVQFPFSHNLSGLKVSFLRDPGVVPHFTLFSAGVMGFAVLVVGILFLKRHPVFLELAAAILIMLWAITPAQIAFRQPSMLRRLTYELQVNPILNVFSKEYLLQNYGAPELVPKRLVLYSAWGRFVAAWSFLRLGWYCFGLGALLVGAYAIAQMPSGRLSRVFILSCLPIGALAIILIPPAIGQHYYADGTLAATLGHDQEAIDNYRKAMRWDSLARTRYRPLCDDRRTAKACRYFAITPQNATSTARSSCAVKTNLKRLCSSSAAPLKVVEHWRKRPNGK